MRAVERWQSFLKQIEERHKLVRDEAVAGAREAFPEGGYDPTPISIAWAGVNDCLLELERRIIDTWHEKVEDVFEAEGYKRPELDVERRKGEVLAYELENARQSAEMHLLAGLAREIHQRALATQKERQCPTCGATLDVPLSYRAVNLRCAHCSSVSTFEPGMLARSAVAFGAHPIAWVTSEREWHLMRQAERRVHDQRPPVPLALLKDYERAQITYWFSYFKTKSQFEPELHDVAREVRARMAWWYDSHAEHEEEWLAAGRPREVF